MVLIRCLRYARSICPKTVSNKSPKELLRLGNVTKSCERHMGGARKIPNIPTGLEWKVFKDQFHYYFMTGTGVTFAFIAYLNLTEGPAELAEIPEGYEPKPWEYHKDPVERFMAKYIFPTPEKQYERNLHYVYMYNEYDRMSKMQRAVQRHMKRNQDFKGWYYIPTPTTPLTEATMGVESLGEPASEINI